MKQEYLNDPLVKALQNVGFNEEEIEQFIANGDAKIEKSKTEKEMDHSEEDEKKNIVNDEKHIKDLEKDKKEDEEDVDNLKHDKKEKMEKGLSYDMLKAIGEGIATGLAKSFDSRFESLEKSLETIGHQTPSFKAADLSSVSFLEKSLESFKDESGKLEVNIVTQRPAAKALIEKALENADDDLMKSIGEDAKSYLMFPEAEIIGENLARYMFEKQNVKFVK